MRTRVVVTLTQTLELFPDQEVEEFPTEYREFLGKRLLRDTPSSRLEFAKESAEIAAVEGVDLFQPWELFSDIKVIHGTEEETG